MPCTMWDLKAVAVHTMKLDGCAVDECWPRCYTQHKRAVKQLDALSVGARTKASSTLQCEESAIVAWVAIFYARGLQPKSLQRRKLRSSSVEAGRRGREVAVDALERDSVVHHHGCSLAPMSRSYRPRRALWSVRTSARELRGAYKRARVRASFCARVAAVRARRRGWAA